MQSNGKLMVLPENRVMNRAEEVLLNRIRNNKIHEAEEKLKKKIEKIKKKRYKIQRVQWTLPEDVVVSQVATLRLNVQGGGSELVVYLTTNPDNPDSSDLLHVSQIPDNEKFVYVLCQTFGPGEYLVAFSDSMFISIDAEY